MDFWFDDPVFDNAEEEFGGKLFVGDEWRTLQYWKEVRGMRDLIRVAGTSVRIDLHSHLRPIQDSK